MGREDDVSLEEALEQTFPASDPVSMQQAVIVGGQDNRSPPGKKDRKTAEGSSFPVEGK